MMLLDMMEKIYYIKEGKRYKPVSYYDSDMCHSFPEGSSIVTIAGNGSYTRYGIDPALAPMIAAGMFAKDDMIKVVREAGEARLRETTVTAEEAAAWDNLKHIMGDTRYFIQYPAAQDVVAAGLAAMQHEANKMLDHPTVKAAYEQFLMVCELTKEQEHK